MNKEIKARWVAALRSGEYTQGRSALRNADGMFCCLGVLCDIAVKDGVIGEPVSGPHGDWRYGARWEAGILPEEVVKWAGLDSESPDVETLEGEEVDGEWEEAYRQELTSLNDSGSTFYDIAYLIEDQL